MPDDPTRGAAHEPVSPKGFPPGAHGEGLTAGLLGVPVLDAGFHLPIAVLHEPTVRANSRVMADYCARHGMSLAPHGKTTMSPELLRIQLDDGAWAITAATVWQARTMLALGVPRVLIANEVVSEPEMRWLVETVEAGADVCCYVDSVAGVQRLEATCVRSGTSRPVRVLLEVGIPGERGGVRSVEQGRDVAVAARDAPHLQLVGVSGFEGVIPPGSPGANERVLNFLDVLGDVAAAVDRTGAFDHDSELILTAGGSAYFDLVVAALSRVELRRETRGVLRSGCYLTHADGDYEFTSPMGSAPRVAEDEGRLRAAMEVWAVVLSRPEATSIIIGAGKRDLSSDVAPPVVRGARRPSGREISTSAEVIRLHDQHAVARVNVEDPIEVGDLVALGVRHPCTTFDRWQVIPMVDDDHRIRALAHTCF